MRAVWVGWVLVAGCAVSETASGPAPSDPALPLLEALGNSDPDVREAAFTDLRRLAATVEPRLRDGCSHPDPEVAGRCRDLLRELDQERRLPVGRVVTLNAGQGYLHLDPVRGRAFLPGERFELLRGKTWVATAEFAQLVGQPALARMAIVDGDASGLHEFEVSVVPGGIEARLAAQAAPVEASVILIDDERACVEIGFRQRDGLKRGAICEVLRGGVLVGRVAVEEVCACGSIAFPYGGTRLDDLRPGDQVAR